MDDNLTGVWWGICALLKIDGIVSSGSEPHRLREQTFSSHCHAHWASGWVRSMATERGGLHIIAQLLKRTMHKSTSASMSAHQLMSLFHIQCCWALISDSQNFWHILYTRKCTQTYFSEPRRWRNSKITHSRNLRHNYTMHTFCNYTLPTSYDQGWQSIHSNRRRVITS